MTRVQRQSRPATPYLHRPPVVTAIALTEIVKAAVILLAVWIAWQHPGAQYRSGLLWRVFDVLTSGRSDFEVMAPLLAGYALAVGCGLWFLEKWARRTLMASSGLTSFCWGLEFFMRWRYRGSLADLLPHSMPDLYHYSYDSRSLYAMILIDAAIFLYLAFGHNVPEAFASLDA